MTNLYVPPRVGEWFSSNREKYEWHSDNRIDSESKIMRLRNETRVAINKESLETLQGLLVRIHRWKTSGRKTDMYEESLKKCGMGYICGILKMAPFNKADGLQEVIERLMEVHGCNLPTSTAIASFLYGRKEIPVFDRYISLFFAKRFKISSVDSATRKVLDWIETVDFILNNGGKKLNGTRALRPSYNLKATKTNLKLYVDALVPECSRIAGTLSGAGFLYTGIDGTKRTFTAIDVEMAIFAWCMSESGRFNVAARC